MKNDNSPRLGPNARGKSLKRTMAVSIRPIADQASMDDGEGGFQGGGAAGGGGGGATWGVSVGSND